MTSLNILVYTFFPLFLKIFIYFLAQAGHIDSNTQEIAAELSSNSLSADQQQMEQNTVNLGPMVSVEFDNIRINIWLLPLEKLTLTYYLNYVKLVDLFLKEGDCCDVRCIIIPDLYRFSKISDMVNQFKKKKV